MSEPVNKKDIQRKKFYMLDSKDKDNQENPEECKKASVRMEFSLDEDNDKFDNIVDDVGTVFSPIATILDMLGFTCVKMEVWNEDGEYFEIAPEILEGDEINEDEEDEDGDEEEA